MKLLETAVVMFTMSPALCLAQASGNIAYSQGTGSGRAEQAERNKRILSRDEMPPNGSSVFVEASVLMNVRADEYVAVFGVLQEGTTVSETMQKMDATVQAFTTDLRALGAAGPDLFVDFIGQNRTYGYDVAGVVAKEKVVG